MTASTDIRIVPVTTEKQRKEFAKFPWRIYKDDPLWVPPMYMDHLALLTPGKHPFWEHAEQQLFLAEREGELVGTISAHVNHRHTEIHKDKVGFFGFFETIDDQGVADALSYLFDEFAALDKQLGIGYVQVFENRGSMMGCSNPHPHAQIWATEGLPNEPGKELRAQKAYHDEHGQALLLDYLAAELEDGARLVVRNEHAVSLVPYWAIWPYETLLMPTRAVTEPGELNPAEVLGFAQVLRQTLVALENFFSASVPYSMGFHPRPSDGQAHPEWQFHLHIYPPLLRSATVKKHLVGFEMLGMPQRDLTPETAAERLRVALSKENI